LVKQKNAMNSIQAQIQQTVQINMQKEKDFDVMQKDLQKLKDKKKEAEGVVKNVTEIFTEKT